MSGTKLSSTKKLLNIIKGKGQGLVYPELTTFSAGEAQPPSGEEQAPDGYKGLGIHALGPLSRMRRSLNLLWGTVCLKMQKGDKQMLFTGCSRYDGVSFISFHLAMYLAMEHNLKVLYVDTDVERPANVAMPFYPEGKPGLSSFVIDDTPIESLILDTNVDGFKIMPSGAGFTSCTCSNIMTRFQQVYTLADYAQSHFDLTIYDCKPVTFSPLVMSFAKIVNLVIMVARYASSRREVCMQAVDRFRQNGIQISGMLLNDRQYPIPRGIYNLIK
jgi:Mrp family chromosome partitioning ATPase